MLKENIYSPLPTFPLKSPGGKIVGRAFLVSFYSFTVSWLLKLRELNKGLNSLGIFLPTEISAEW